jgi:hypothetical protein
MRPELALEPWDQFGNREISAALVCRHGGEEPFKLD